MKFSNISNIFNNEDLNVFKINDKSNLFIFICYNNYSKYFMRICEHKVFYFEKYLYNNDNKCKVNNIKNLQFKQASYYTMFFWYFNQENILYDDAYDGMFCKSDNFINFFNLHTKLLPQEKQILQILSDADCIYKKNKNYYAKQPFYIIIINLNFITQPITHKIKRIFSIIFRHEYAHFLYETNKMYKKSVINLFNNLPLTTKIKFKMYKKYGYELSDDINEFGAIYIGECKRKFINNNEIFNNIKILHEKYIKKCDIYINYMLQNLKLLC